MIELTITILPHGCLGSLGHSRSASLKTSKHGGIDAPRGSSTQSMVVSNTLSYHGRHHASMQAQVSRQFNGKNATVSLNDDYNAAANK